MGFRNKPNKNNSSGCLGVAWSLEKKMWHAKLGYQGRRIHVGYFHSLNDAHEAYMDIKEDIRNGTSKYIRGPKSNMKAKLRAKLRRKKGNK